jgi:hypothetical protein
MFNIPFTAVMVSTVDSPAIVGGLDLGLAVTQRYRLRRVEMALINHSTEAAVLGFEVGDHMMNSGFYRQGVSHLAPWDKVVIIKDVNFAFLSDGREWLRVQTHPNTPNAKVTICLRLGLEPAHVDTDGELGPANQH